MIHALPMADEWTIVNPGGLTGQSVVKLWLGMANSRSLAVGLWLTVHQHHSGVAMARKGSKGATKNDRSLWENQAVDNDGSEQWLTIVVDNS